MISEAATQSPPLALLTSLLMTLMGPVALMPKFAAMTSQESRSRRTQIALLATATAAGVVALAVLGGADKLTKIGVSQPALILAAGLILTLTSLINIVGLAGGGGSSERPKPESALHMGVSPLAIPGIMSPVAVCILLIFASYFPSAENRMKIAGAALTVLVIDFLAMLAANWFMRRVGMFPLVLLGAAFGVLQLALGVEMLISGVARAFGLR